MIQIGDLVRHKTHHTSLSRGVWLVTDKKTIECFDLIEREELLCVQGSKRIWFFAHAMEKI